MLPSSQHEQRNMKLLKCRTIQNTVKEFDVIAVVNGYHIMDKNESNCLSCAMHFIESNFPLKWHHLPLIHTVTHIHIWKLLTTITVWSEPLEQLEIRALLKGTLITIMRNGAKAAFSFCTHIYPAGLGIKTMTSLKLTSPNTTEKISWL